MSTSTFAGNHINLKEFKARSVSGELKITQQEAKLLSFLIENEGNVVERGELLEILGYKRDSLTRTIDNFIVRFRKYFEENPKDPKHFISIRSVGYKFIK